MKKIYIQPSTKTVILGTTTIICGSKDITSVQGITYGGVDEEGMKDPASRRQSDVWEDEDEELY